MTRRDADDHGFTRSAGHGMQQVSFYTPISDR